MGVNFRGLLKFNRFVGRYFVYYLIPSKENRLCKLDLLIRGGFQFVDERYSRIPRKLSHHEI